IFASGTTIGREDQPMGPITISNPIAFPFGTNLRLSGSGGIRPTASGTDIDVGAYGNLFFDKGSYLDVAINSSTPDTGYSRLVVNGTVYLAVFYQDFNGTWQYGALNLALDGTYVPISGEVYTPVSATDLRPWMQNVLPGSTVTFNGRSLQAGYDATTM